MDLELIEMRMSKQNIVFILIQYSDYSVKFALIYVKKQFI